MQGLLYENINKLNSNKLIIVESFFYNFDKMLSDIKTPIENHYSNKNPISATSLHFVNVP